MSDNSFAPFFFPPPVLLSQEFLNRRIANADSFVSKFFVTDLARYMSSGGSIAYLKIMAVVVVAVGTVVIFRTDLMNEQTETEKKVYTNKFFIVLYEVCGFYMLSEYSYTVSFLIALVYYLIKFL